MKFIGILIVALVACRANASRVTLESARMFVGDRTTNEASVVLYSADEAAKVIDTVFKPNCQSREEYPDWKFERMKHLVADGFAALVGYEGSDHERDDWTNKFATMEYRLVHRFRDREEHFRDRDDTELRWFDSENEFRSDRLQLRKESGERVWWGLTGRSEDEERVAVLFGPDQEVGIDDGIATNADVSLVADVETVTLASVHGLEEIIKAGGANGYAYDDAPVHPVGHYRVSTLVRTVLDGECPANRLWFTAKTDSTNATVDCRWLFFRGVSLKVGLRKTADGYSICRVEPVLPYPPYTTDGITVCRGKIPESSRFALLDLSTSKVSAGELTILYGDHTCADFVTDYELISGNSGTLPDFGMNVRTRVWTHGAGSRIDYWRNAWFADIRKCQYRVRGKDSKMTRIRPAVKALTNGMDRVRINWWKRSLPSVSFASPATLKDAAEFMTDAMRPCAGSGDEFCQVIAEASVVRRPVRPFTATDVDAWTLLRRLAQDAGCKLVAEGANISLSAELSDAELAPPRVDELERELTREGFASVAGAAYVEIGLRASHVYSEDVVSGLTSTEDYSRLWLYDDEGLLSGCGWVRTEADRKERFLAFDAVWWDVVEKWCPEGGKEYDGIKMSERTPARLRRDLLRAADTMNLLADGGFGWIVKDNQLDMDAGLLALALHGCQVGMKDDAQRLVDALWRRPVAAKAALAKLRERIARPDVKSAGLIAWYQAKLEETAKARALAAEDDEDEEEREDEEQREDEEDEDE